MTTYVPLVGRILIAPMFLLAGIGKLGDMAGFMGYMASGGVPTFLAWPTVALEVLGGAAILIGFQTRVAAFLLAGFCLLTALLFHLVPADQMQMTIFLKNVAVAGGLLMLVAFGPGSLSVDKR
ncbi:MAG: hypothetical protein DI533_02555 [Cereibacter sphaeroides]|uniref:DoxX family protein n=1 Tax=Cereibacter sphaeroides TaxID=1063 RepID=A0A2W5TU74_CERSP|nr:MAG: hypothetical protein DI533_02555 [Cereibacter sphaeroides]